MARAFTAGAAPAAEKIDLASAINLSSTRTIAAWVRPNNANTNARNIYINGVDGQQDQADWNAFFILTDGAGTNEMRYGHGHASGFSVLDWVTGWAAGTWHFIALTYDVVTLRFFSGALGSAITEVASQAATTTPSTPASPVMRIGNHAVSSFSWDGRIANMALYSGSALSLGALKTLATGRIPGEGRSNLVASLSLFGASTEPDWSGNGRNGTVTGATIADHVPLGPPFGYDEPFVSAAAEDLSHVAALAESFDNAVQRRPIKITSF